MARKRGDIDDQPDWPGSPTAEDPRRALIHMERLAGSVVVAVEEGLPLEVRSVADARDAAGIITGLSASGARTAALISGSRLAQVVPELASAAANHLPFLVHHACERGHAASRASHDAVVALRDAGCVLLLAADAQEVLDLALVGRRIAELALVPVVVAQDTFAGPYHLSTVRVPERAMLSAWIGKPADLIPSPTASQRLLFGESRRRLPRLLNIDRPIGLGSRLDKAAASRTLAGQDVFFNEEIPKIAGGVFTEFAAATGRNCAPIADYRADDADYVVVAAGRVTKALRAVVDELRSEHRKVGIVDIKMYRPLPESRLSTLLANKKAVTVLESVAIGGSQDPPLMADLRCLLDRSRDTGVPGDGGRAHSGRKRAESQARSPVLFSVVSRNAADASHEDLRAIFDNMLTAGPGGKRYHLGVRFGVPQSSRIPGLERLGQLLETAYGGLNLRGLTGSGRRTTADAGRTVIKLIGMADQHPAMAGTALAVGLFRNSGGVVESRPPDVRHTDFEPETCTVFHAPDDRGRAGSVVATDIIAATHLNMITDVDVVDSVPDEGHVIVSTNASPIRVWDVLPDRLRTRIREKRLHLSLVPGPSIAERIASDKWVQTQLEMHSLVGAVLQVLGQRLGNDGHVAEHYRSALSETWASGDHLLEQLLDAVDQGMSHVSGFETDSLSTPEAKPGTEPAAPWTVRDIPEHDDSVYDAGRFWNAVGYLYATGRSDDTMVDPYVASGVLPGRTSAFRSWAGFATRLPQFLPENCTACGACFVSCPDSALPVTVASVTELLADAMQRAEESGVNITQLRRIEKHLATQAHRLVSGDQRHEFRTLADLVLAAHERLVARMELDESDAEQIREEADAVANVCPSFPISRTETFFGEAEKQEKGSGLVFSINVNADACKACGLCAAVCPEGAMEMTQSTPELAEQYRRDWRTAMHMPVTRSDRIDRFIREDQPSTAAYRLLDRRAYHSVLGGDSAFPGSGTRATLHVVAGIADSIIRPRAERLRNTVNQTIEDLKNVIRDYVHQSVDVNDFEEFGKRLKEIDAAELKPERLAGLAQTGEGVDRRRLVQLNTALSDLEAMRRRHTSQGTSGTAMAAAFSLQQPEANSAAYPYNPFSFPWINVPPGDAPAVAEGLFEGIARELIEDLRTLRTAKMILDDVYEGPHADHVENFDWSDLSDEERDLCPPVCAVVRHQYEVLPHLLNLGFPVKIFVLDNGSVLNADSPQLHLWPMVRPDAFVMRSALGTPDHCLPGLINGIGSQRPALFHLYVAEPSIDGVLPDQTIDSMRLATESRAFPLMIYDPDRSVEWSGRWDISGNLGVADDWYARTVTEEISADLSNRTVPYTVADWAVQMGRYRQHFRHVRRNSWHSGMVSLVEFLAMDTDDRDGWQPYIEVSLGEGRTARVEVLPEMVAATEAALRSWRLLQELGAVQSSVVERVTSRLRDDFAQQKAQLKSSMTTDYATQLHAERQSFESQIHVRLTEELLTLSGYGSESARARERLLDFAGIASEDDMAGGGAADTSQESEGAAD